MDHLNESSSAPLRLHSTLIEPEGLRRLKRIEKERARMAKRRRTRARRAPC